MFTRWLVLLLLVPLLASAKDKEVTRELLMKGLTVPERRDFPLSSKVKPCEDFHKYVCDEVERRFKLPADRSSWTFAFTDSSERLLQAKRNYFRLIEKGYKPRTKRAEQLKNYYLACMKPSARKTQEREFVKKEMDAVRALKTNQEVIDFLAGRLTDPRFTFASFSDIANQDNPSQRDLYLMVDLMTLPERSYYSKKDVMKDFRKVAVSFFKTLKLDNPEKRADSLLEFERAFAETYPLPAEFRQRVSSKTYMSRKDFEKNYAEFKFKGLFAKVPSKVQIRNLTKESLQFVSAALKEKSPDVLQNLILFHSLSGVMDEAYPGFFKTYFDFQHKHLGGPKKRPPLQERCTRQVMASFGMELDYELLPVLFPDFPEDKVVQAAEKVRKAILEGIKENKWLSSQARKEARKKIEKASMKLVKPKTDKDWNFLPVRTYDPKKPIDNYFTMLQAKLDRLFSELKEKRNRDQWKYLSPLTINAYYSSADNQFVLLQGILQWPFFDGAAPETENLGAIGAVVGHELGHGIDDQGSKYDADGKLRQWMTMKDLAEFSQRGKQFIDRFEKIGHNGQLTLGENIGDHVGITFAHRAAFPDPTKVDPEQEKKFFMSYARVWCTVMRPEYAQVMLKTNPHALGWARINEQVIHHDGFYRAFSCKAGDKMFVEAKDRIRVW